MSNICLIKLNYHWPPHPTCGPCVLRGIPGILQGTDILSGTRPLFYLTMQQLTWKRVVMFSSCLEAGSPPSPGETTKNGESW